MENTQGGPFEDVQGYLKQYSPAKSFGGFGGNTQDMTKALMGNAQMGGGQTPAPPPFPKGNPFIGQPLDNPQTISSSNPIDASKPLGNATPLSGAPDSLTSTSYMTPTPAGMPSSPMAVPGDMPAVQPMPAASSTPGAAPYSDNGMNMGQNTPAHASWAAALNNTPSKTMGALFTPPPASKGWGG